MAKKPHLSDEDNALWTQVTSDITPIKVAKKIAKLNKPKKLPIKTRSEDPGKESVLGSKERARTTLNTIDARLDLHGFTLDGAYSVLESFIATQHYKGSRCVLVITGKGGKKGAKGALQEDVPRWLSHSNMSKMVAGYTTALLKDGGDGALYVTLKRKR